MPHALQRRLGLPGAVMLGLGSIIGTGVFVSIGLAAGVAGSAVAPAIALAGLLALCNGLSSAQLAAAHPVSGGTYEYGYRLLHPTLGFTAGWMFLAAKSASAATAALGCAGYLLSALPDAPRGFRTALAVLCVAGLTLLVLSGLRRTSGANALIVCVTIAALALFIAVGAVRVGMGAAEEAPSRAAAAVADDASDWSSLLHATALMFVAYTGYGRIATLGEEVRSPRRTIPRAILVTLAIAAALYLGVALVGVAAVGPAGFHDATRHDAAPLVIIARGFNDWLPLIVAIGAVTAMLGVLLNLILGLSRVALAMARRRDLPGLFARLSGPHATPAAAVLLVAAIIVALAAIGSVQAAWSFSALTVLIYYGITNLVALRLPPHQRLYSRAWSGAGLIGCIGLAYFVEWRYWAMGLALIAIGLAWQALARRIAARTDPAKDA